MFTDRDPGWSHALWTCEDCGTYTFTDVRGGSLHECAKDCPNHPCNNPYPDYNVRFFAEVENENGSTKASQLAGQPAPTGPDDDGFHRRNRWLHNTSEHGREIFIPGTGWVAS